LVVDFAFSDFDAKSTEVSVVESDFDDFTFESVLVADLPPLDLAGIESSPFSSIITGAAALRFFSVSSVIKQT
jgi:hypothetical protein